MYPKKANVISIKWIDINYPITYFSSYLSPIWQESLEHYESKREKDRGKGEEKGRERERNVSVGWQKIQSKTKRPSFAARLSRQKEKKGDTGVASRKILVDFWRTIEVVNAHRRRAVSIIDITALCYISFYVSAFCHAARLSVSNVRFYVSRLRFQRKRPVRQ